VAGRHPGSPETSHADPSPASALLVSLAAELRRHAPFAGMAQADVEAFVSLASECYYAPGETLLRPAEGPVSRLLYLRRGHVAGGPADAAFQLEPGDLFPVAAWLGRRAVSAPYTAIDDCFCLEVPADAMRRLAERCPVLNDFLHQRLRHVLTLSRQAMRSAFATQALSEQSLETRLGDLPRRPLAACSADAPLRDMLRLMQQRRVGSVLVLDAAGAAQGIFTRHDLLERVALAQPAMDTPAAALMTRPVHTLDAGQRLQDAALLMSRHGLRHVPVTEGGRVVAMVSERDLFALQRLSLRRIGNTLRAADSLDALIEAAPDIRRLAGTLMAQGLAARALTELVSHLNDLLTERAVQLAARQQGLELQRACWLAFCSEGRGEQTIATDQDNGLVFDSADPEAERVAWMALGKRVNQALDACGIPLCKGRIMAGEAQCCLSADEWQACFAHWIDQGAPEALLNASIYFDFRPITGRAALAAPMRDAVRERAAQTPRFLRQMAQNALRNTPPLNWRGAIETQSDGAHQWFDLKLHGTMIFVDAARLFALAHGVDATGTRQRFEAAAAAMNVAPREYQSWIGAFEFLQTLRLRVHADAHSDARGEQPNRLDLAALNDIDRRMLKEALRTAQRLQQRIAMDHKL
jgi:CBS domain-containing protein